MTFANKKEDLLKFIADLKEEEALETVRRLLTDGYDAISVLKACQEGLRLVGQRYEKGEYYITGLIMGGEILQTTMEIIRPDLEKQLSTEDFGRVVVGTVEGDIHDIGKNIVCTLLSCNGFQVIDLGADVPAEAFIEATRVHKPKVLGLSCLLSSAVESMKSIISAIDEAGLREGMPIIIGGNVLDEEACRFSGADYWTRDAMDGVAWCLRMGGREIS